MSDCSGNSPEVNEAESAVSVRVIKMERSEKPTMKIGWNICEDTFSGEGFLHNSFFPVDRCDTLP